MKRSYNIMGRSPGFFKNPHPYNRLDTKEVKRIPNLRVKNYNKAMSRNELGFTKR